LYIQTIREDEPEDGSVHELKNIARNTTNTSNKLRIVHDYIILATYIVP